MRDALGSNIQRADATRVAVVRSVFDSVSIGNVGSGTGSNESSRMCFLLHRPHDLLKLETGSNACNVSAVGSGGASAIGQTL